MRFLRPFHKVVTTRHATPRGGRPRPSIQPVVSQGQKRGEERDEGDPNNLDDDSSNGDRDLMSESSNRESPRTPSRDVKLSNDDVSSSSESSAEDSPTLRNERVEPLQHVVSAPPAETPME